MAYLNSTKVKVFPSAYRGKNGSNQLFNPESRLNTEKNLIGIPNRLTSRNSFVLTKDFYLESGDTNKKLECCIHGYWFELTLSYSDFDTFSNGKVYGFIKIEAKNSSPASGNIDYEAESLSPLNGDANTLDTNGGVFVGLDLSDTDVDLSGALLLVKDEDTWIVPDYSKFKIELQDVGIGYFNEDEEANCYTLSDYLGVLDGDKNISTDIAYITQGNITTINSENIHNANTIDTYDILLNKKTSGNSLINFNNAFKISSNCDSTNPSTTLTNGATEIKAYQSGSGLNETNYLEVRTNSFIVDPSIQMYSTALGSPDYKNNCYNITIGKNNGSSDYTNTISLNAYSISLNAINNLNLSENISSNLIPLSSSTYSLGSSTYKWRNLYLGGTAEINIISGASATFTGNVQAQTFTATSDARLKENIKTFEPHKSILDLDVVEFDYKDTGKHSIGCLAQDLQKICPEIVHENEDGYLSIEENKIVYLLLEEVKELKRKIENK